MELGPAVAAAFDLELQRDVLEPLLEFAQRELHWGFAGLSGQFEGPIERIDVPGIWRYAIVPDEHPFGGRHRVVQEVCRRFRIDGTFAQDLETGFAGDGWQGRLTGG